MTPPAAFAVVDYVVRSSWLTRRGILALTWLGVALLLLPLEFVVSYSVGLRAEWQRVGHGALLWTAVDTSGSGRIVGEGCHMSVPVAAHASRVVPLWIASPTVWPLVGWQATPLPRATSPARMLLVPTNFYYPLVDAVVLHGTVLASAGQIRPPNGTWVGMPHDAWLLERDAETLRAVCAGRLGVFRLVDQMPGDAAMMNVAPLRLQLVHTPSNMALSAWRDAERVLVGVLIGACIALIVLAFAAAHFWAAGQAREWAVARLCGARWALLRWQVVVEAVWLLAPGIVAGAWGSSVVLRWSMRRMRFSTPPDFLFAAIALVIGAALLTVLGFLLWGRLRRLSPVEGLREAREWHG